MPLASPSHTPGSITTKMSSSKIIRSAKRKRGEFSEEEDIIRKAIALAQRLLMDNLFNVWDYIWEHKVYSRKWSAEKFDAVNVVVALQIFCKPTTTPPSAPPSAPPAKVIENIIGVLDIANDANIDHLRDFTKGLLETLFWKMLFVQLTIQREHAEDEKRSEEYVRLQHAHLQKAEHRAWKAEQRIK